MTSRKISYTKRKKIFTRDKFTCRYCGRKADEVLDRRGSAFKLLITLVVYDDWRPFEIDHKKPRSAGGTNHPNNLLTSCAKCNNKKSNKSYKEFLSIITNSYGTKTNV